MILRNTSQYYGIVAVSLHWLIALALIGLFISGTIMVDLPLGSQLQLTVYETHKSIGITILILSLVRLWWRLINPIPSLPNNLKPWEKFLAKLTHRLFYVLMILIPLSGWILVSASKWNIPTELYGLIPFPHLPFFTDMTFNQKEATEGIWKGLHEVLGKMMLVLFILHVAAALKHHFFLKDDVLLRMIRPKR